jgi:hypothetical protein
VNEIPTKSLNNLGKPFSVVVVPDVYPHVILSPQNTAVFPEKLKGFLII